MKLLYIIAGLSILSYIPTANALLQPSYKTSEAENFELEKSVSDRYYVSCKPSIRTLTPRGTVIGGICHISDGTDPVYDGSEGEEEYNARLRYHIDCLVKETGKKADVIYLPREFTFEYEILNMILKHCS